MSTKMSPPYMIQAVHMDGVRHVFPFPEKSHVWDHWCLFEREFHDGVWTSVSLWQYRAALTATGEHGERIYVAIAVLGD